MRRFRFTGTAKHQPVSSDAASQVDRFFKELAKSHRSILDLLRKRGRPFGSYSS